MKIFIPRVPNTVSVNELRKFSAGLLEKRFHIPFTPHPGLTSCDILLIKDVQLGMTEHHGVISIWPDSAGKWFIQNLKSQRLHNKLLLGREYYSRTHQNKVIPPENDRRRKHLEIGKLGPHGIYAEGMDQFVQSHIG